MEAMTAETVRARKIVELAFNVSLDSCSLVDLQRAVEVSVRVGNGGELGAATARADGAVRPETGDDAGILGV